MIKKTSFFAIAGILSLAVMSCNNNGAGKEDPKPTDTTGEVATTSAPAAQPFSKEVTYGNYKFLVTSQGEADQHHFKLIPSGLTESNDTLFADVKGSITDVIIDDLDGDNSPEIGVVDMFGPNGMGHLHMFSTNNGKSISMVNIVDAPESDPAWVGYKGGDEFQFVEGYLIRRFSLYEGETKTAKTRQFQCKLKAGEAMKQLVVVKTIDY